MISGNRVTPFSAIFETNNGINGTIPRVVIMVMTYCGGFVHILVCESPLALKSTSFTFIKIVIWYFVPQIQSRQ